MGNQIIDPTSIGFETIKADLEDWVKSKPDGATWKDFYDSSVGTTIIELVAGLAAFNAFHEMVKIRESQLDSARFRTSVVEQAFDRGLFLCPTDSAELILTVKPRPGDTLSVVQGELVGTLDDYDLFSLDTKTWSVQDTLRVVVGHLNEFTVDLSGMEPFRRLSFTLQDYYAATQLEHFSVDGVELLLMSDLNYLTTIRNDFLLRRLLEWEIRVYFGNGILGYYNENAVSCTYKCLSYGDDLATRLGNSPSLNFDCEIISQEIIQPHYGMTTDEIRGMATFYPLDGRIVTDKDYEVVIMKYFGGLLRDVYSFNTDPDQQIYLIVEDVFNDSNLNDLRNHVVNIKRAMGMRTYYYVKHLYDGVQITTSFKVKDTEFDVGLSNRIKAYLDTKLFKFLRVGFVIRTIDLAVELSANLGVNLYPGDSNETTLTPIDFIKAISFTLTVV